VQPENQCSNENPLHQPCGRLGKLKTLDEKRRRCGGGGFWLGFSSLPEMLYL
jgi:hypothetical protein